MVGLLHVAEPVLSKAMFAVIAMLRIGGLPGANATVTRVWEESSVWFIMNAVTSRSAPALQN